MALRALLFGGLVALLLCTAVLGSSFVPGYTLSGVKADDHGLSGTLTRRQDSKSPYGDDVDVLQLDVTYETPTRMRIRIYDPKEERWEVPLVLNEHRTQTPRSSADSSDGRAYHLSYTEDPFGLAVSRVGDTPTTIFNTSVTQPLSFNGLIFSNQYLELTTRLASEDANLYGLGERVHNLRLNPSNATYTLWARDQGCPVDKNLYGSHPVHLEVVPSGLAHGIFLLNSNAMDVTLHKGLLTYKTIGGILDLFVLMGPTPDAVVRQYTELVGFPYLPPYWALGFHNCRWGYKTVNDTRDVVERYRNANIPLETMWNDLDYMDGFRIFSLDPTNYPPSEMHAFVESLHANNQHYVQIIDPGVKVDDKYSVYENLLKAGSYIRGEYDEPLIGQVWPGQTIFPDFFVDKTKDFWKEELARHHTDHAAVDGAWIDMNEVANFCDGRCDAKPLGKENHPPFVPGGDALYLRTLTLSGQQEPSLMYDTHSMYGFTQAIATKEAMESIRGKRALVISRSTFPGHGHHAGHWLGDNVSQWSDLFYSISGVLSMQIFGIPLVGADVCGFADDTSEELCGRWIQVGALGYPFCRVHNSIGSASQELYVWDSVADISRKALALRYSLLPYIYTLFHHAHSEGSTVMRPVFFEFPQDTTTWKIDKQWMIGSSLLVSPVLDQGATSVSAYFPAARWYDFVSGKEVQTEGKQQWITLDAPRDVIPVHIRGGSILVLQKPGYTITDSRKNPFSLLVALDEQGSAVGNLYLDDGDSINVGDKLTAISYSASTRGNTGKFLGAVVRKGFTPETTVVERISVLGVSSKPAWMKVNGDEVTIEYDDATHALSCNTSSVRIDEDVTVTWGG